METMEPERIYSSTQLVEALQSGLVGLKEQLQVLNILDGSASSWPGLGASVTDLEALIAVSAKRISALEDKQQQVQQAKTTLDGQLTQVQQSLTAAKFELQKLQVELMQERQQCHQLQQNLTVCEQTADSSKRQVWELERTKADLAAAVAKARSEGEFMEGELSGVREQLEEQKHQVSRLKEELAAKSSELVATSTLLQENKGRLDDVKSQLTQVQQHSRQQLDAAQQLLLKTTDSAAAQLRQIQQNLGSQVGHLQIELTDVRGENQQLRKGASQLQQEVSSLSAALQGSNSEVARLREFQDIVKRVAEDKVVEVNAAMAALQQQMQQQQAAAADNFKSLQDKLHQREAESSGLQRQIGLFQVQTREAQRAQAAAAEAQAAAGVTLNTQRAEITTLQQTVKDANSSAERMKADHVLAESTLRESCAAEVSELRHQLDESRREAAVARAMVDAWQRDNKALQDRISQMESAAAASSSAAESAHASAAQERLTLHAQAAAHEAAVRELKIQLEEQRQEVKRVRAEAVSLAKRYEQALVKLRREADAGAEEVRRLNHMRDTAMTPTTASPATAELASQSVNIVNLPAQAAQHQRGSGSPAVAAVEVSVQESDMSRKYLQLSHASFSPVTCGHQVSDKIQQEINDLKSYMHTVSSNLEAADAAMRAVAAAAQSKQTTPPQQAAALNRVAQTSMSMQTVGGQADDGTPAHTAHVDEVCVAPTACPGLDSHKEHHKQQQLRSNAVKPAIPMAAAKACGSKTIARAKHTIATAVVSKAATATLEKQKNKLAAAARSVEPGVVTAAASAAAAESSTSRCGSMLCEQSQGHLSSAKAAHEDKHMTVDARKANMQPQLADGHKLAASHEVVAASACKQLAAQVVMKQGKKVNQPPKKKTNPVPNVSVAVHTRSAVQPVG